MPNLFSDLYGGSSSCGESSGEKSAAWLTIPPLQSPWLCLKLSQSIGPLLVRCPSGVGGTTEILGNASNGSNLTRFAAGWNCDSPMSINDQSSTPSSSSLLIFVSFIVFVVVLLSQTHRQFRCDIFVWWGRLCCNSATLFTNLHVSFRTSCDVRMVFWKLSGLHLHLQGVLFALWFSLCLGSVCALLDDWIGWTWLEFVSGFGVPLRELGFSELEDNWLVRASALFVVDVDFWLLWLLAELWQQRTDDAWLCWTFNELLTEWASFCLQFLWQWRHTDILSKAWFWGLDRTVICPFKKNW